MAAHRASAFARRVVLVAWALSAPLGASVVRAASGPGAAPAAVDAARATTVDSARASSAAADSTRVASAAAADSAAVETLAAAPAPDYLARVRSDFTPDNRAYSARRKMLVLLEPAWAVAVSLVILFGGFAARMRDVALGLGRTRYVRVLVFFVLYTALGFILSFPISWYSGFALEHQFGLSNQTFGTWFADELKGQAVEIVFLGVIPLLALVYRAIERSPKRWWAWLALGTLPVIVFAVLIEPVAIDPIFNHFTPLKNEHLRQAILAEAERAGVPARHVFEVDKSAQTRTLNAYVNGFGASQRIVIWDTTLKAMSEDEILYVVGHEIGHYQLGHVWKGILMISALAALLFYVSFRVMRWAVGRFARAWGFRELHDVASLPLLAATLTVVSLVAQPLINAESRRVEHEADLYGLELTRLNDAAARAFIKLGAQNKSDPEPSAFVRVLMYSHPPMVERVRTALEYRPWEHGQPNRFFKPGR
jgi:Zn-dependent protease with chaperone function